MNCATNIPSNNATGALIKPVQQIIARRIKMISRVLNCLSKKLLPGMDLVRNIHLDYAHKVLTYYATGEMVSRNDRLPEVMG